MLGVGMRGWTLMPWREHWALPGISQLQTPAPLFQQGFPSSFCWALSLHHWLFVPSLLLVLTCRTHSLVQNGKYVF